MAATGLTSAAPATELLLPRLSHGQQSSQAAVDSANPGEDEAADGGSPSASSPSPAAAASASLCDVFLSHSSADKPAVELLARRLLATGIQPWLDSWNLIPGDPWQEGLEEALDTCATCAVFLGPSGIGPWHNEELRVALDRRARDRTRSYRVIPVLLPGADPADPNTLLRFLSRMTWVDFRGGLEDANAFNRLLAGIRGVAPGPGSAAAAESSLQASSTVPSRSANSLTASQRQRREAELARLHTQYDTYTRRLVALDTSADQLAVAEFERRLSSAGVRPWLAAARLIPGRPWQEAMEAALAQSETVAAFIGP